jgi:hypothetical protein
MDVRAARIYELLKDCKMAKNVNQLIEPQEPEQEVKEPKPEKRQRFLGKVILDVLGGDFLAYDWARRQINYVFFLAALALLYIANSYYAEDMSRSIDDTNREIKELHYEYISSKSELMHQTKQSEVAKKLEKTGLKESVEPVKKLIRIKEETK